MPRSRRQRVVLAVLRGIVYAAALLVLLVGIVLGLLETPWGKVTTYALKQTSSVRRITIEPGQETSEHYHQLRDEMWVVLDPGLVLQIGTRKLEPQPGDEFVVTAEEAHRIRNTGQRRGRVLEVAYGYTTEDDTLRLQDDYGRPLDPDW